MKLLLTFTLMTYFSITAFSQEAIPEDINALLTKNMCNTCHQLEGDLIGPSYTKLAEKNEENDIEGIMKLIYEPQPSNWPDYPPMAPMPFLDKKEVKVIAEWLAALTE